jgi:signal peptidase I
MAEGAPGDVNERLPAAQLRKEWEEKPDATGPQDKAESVLKEWVGLLVKAGVCALLLYQFVFQVFVVRQGSMAPTFREGEWVVVDKLTYRFRGPQRGEVVVFELLVPDDGRRVYRDFIKRLVAGPGDRLRICGDVVYVNGDRVAEPYLVKQGPEVVGPPDEYFVPPGHYFVMGDHRSDSRDSRYDPYRGTLGLVPESRIKGIVRW